MHMTIQYICIQMCIPIVSCQLQVAFVCLCPIVLCFGSQRWGRGQRTISPPMDRISQSEILHREALRCWSMLLRHDAPAFVNATSPQAPTPPEASVTFTTIRRRRADVILHDDDMSDLVKREITELALNGSNYLSWSLDAEIVLDGKNLLHAIKPNNNKKATSAERAQALHFLGHHISSPLKNEYMTERDPQVLWNVLHERFEKMETILLPRVKREWQNLRYQDYNTVEDYNAKLYGIVTRMKLCGTTLTESDLIEKTLSTFHPKLTYLSRQYKKESTRSTLTLVMLYSKTKVKMKS